MWRLRLPARSMTITNISLRNLFSLKGERTLNFSQKNASAPSFSAFVGSSDAEAADVLNAVCLTLFGCLANDDGATLAKDEAMTDGDDATKAAAFTVSAQSVLHPSCKEGSTEVTFVSLRGETWQVALALRSKKKEEGTIVRTLRCLAPTEREIDADDVDRCLKEAVATDCPQFVRTVLLVPQAFSRILNADAADRASVLEEYVGTEIYPELLHKIELHTAQQEHQVEIAENRLQEVLLHHLSADDLAAQQDAQRLCQSSLSNLATRCDLLTRQLRWMDANEAVCKLLKASEEAYAEANRQYAARRSEEEMLKRRDAALAVVPLYQEVTMREADVAAMQQKVDDVRRLAAEAQKRVQQTEEMLQTAREATAEAKGLFAQRRPIIARGERRAGQIAMKEDALGHAKKAQAAAFATLTARTEVITKKREELQAAEEREEQLLLRQQALSVHRRMFDKFDLVKDKFSVLHSEATRSETLHRKVAEYQKQQTHLRSVSDGIEQHLRDSRTAMESVKSELFLHRQSNQGHDGKVIQNRFSDYRNRLLALERAEALWARIVEGYEDVENRRAEISRLEMTIAQKTQELQRAERSLAVAEEDEQRKMEALTLSRSQNIVALRQRLKEGTACPICGGTHHPYHTETERELGEQMNNLEVASRETTEERSRKQTDVDALRQDLASLTAQLATQRRNLQTQEDRQRRNEEEWGACAALDATFAECSPTVNRDNRRLTIGMLKDDTQRKLAEAEKELETFNYHQEHINRLSEQISAHEAQRTEEHNQYEEIQRELSTIAILLESAEQDMQIADRAVEETYRDLDELVSVQSWFTEWKDNTDSFRRKMASLFDDWTQTTKRLNDEQHTVRTLRKETSELQQRILEAQQICSQTRDNCEAIEEDLKDKREAMEKDFGASTPEEEEKKLADNLSKALAAETTAREEYAAATTTLQQLIGQKEAMDQYVGVQKRVCSESMTLLDDWLQQYNTSHSPMQFAELKRLLSDSRDWNALRAAVDTLKSNLASAALNLASAREEWQRTDSSTDKPADESTTSREALEARLRKAEEETVRQKASLADIDHVLRRHEESEKRANDLLPRLKEAKKNAEAWTTLCTGGRLA